MVKFTMHFKDEIIPEWSDEYLDFEELKRVSNRNYLLESDNLSEMIQTFDARLFLELDKINVFYKKQIEIINIWINLYNNESNDSIQDNDIVSFEQSFQEIFDKCDKLRQYVLLNTIAVIKIVKRRNKRTPNTTNITDILEENDFYKCTELKKAYNDLTNITKKVKTEYADELMQNTTMIVSFKSLASIRDKSNFEEYNYLPNYDSNKMDDDTIKNYLNEKLGPGNNLESLVSLDSEVTPEDFTNNNNISLKWKIFYFFIILFLLYLFIFGLNLMSSSFKVLSGKGMSILSSISNPIAGVMIGIIATVLLQSSSTSTSIVVTMVGANILTVLTAIPIIMGANIGTSVTNTLVSHAHIKNIEEFRRAFAGATVHDMFNFLSVIILLPIEIISQAAGYSILYNLADGLTGLFVGSEGTEFKSPIKVIVSPITNAFLKVNKDVIKASAMGCVKCNTTITADTCWNVKRDDCLLHPEWVEKYQDAQVIKSGFLKDVGDAGGGAIGLIISLLALCVALYYIVKILHKLVMSSGGKGRLLRWLKKSLSISSYLTMLFGVLLTIAVQSSSITTSTFTPLVGLNILTVEQMFPLTLGANIGTTFTAILASLVTDSRNAIQIAMCHFLFNIFGILIWYPIPLMRKVPLNMAFRLGDLVAKFKWFGIFYILYAFLLFPAINLGISYIIDINTVGLVFGIILILATIVLSVFLFYKFDYVGYKIENMLERRNMCISCLDDQEDQDNQEEQKNQDTILNMEIENKGFRVTTV